LTRRLEENKMNMEFRYKRNTINPENKWTIKYDEKEVQDTDLSLQLSERYLPGIEKLFKADSRITSIKLDVSLILPAN